jgi:hypothetical protein
MGASDAYLNQLAVRLTGRPDDCSFALHDLTNSNDSLCKTNKGLTSRPTPC